MSLVLSKLHEIAIQIEWSYTKYKELIIKRLYALMYTSLEWITVKCALNKICFGNLYKSFV